MTPEDAQPRQRRTPEAAEKKSPPALDHSSSSSSSTSFYASQVGGSSVINYSYTDRPSILIVHDIYQFFRLAWALPYIVWPFTPASSGHMAELAPTPGNFCCLAVHGLLVVLQSAFILCVLPAVFFFPAWVAVGAIGLCLAVNCAICTLLNGEGIEYHSSPECAPARPEHAHEQWIFLNGVAVGKHWMQSNLDRLALTFRRPILGVHNKTNGIIFDVIECLIQRNFTYATTDVRLAYAIVKDKLYQPGISRVVLILHSQGGIEGSLVLDWLLQELPQDLLTKLEVYTFGNAANHFNNPHHTIDAQRRELQASLCDQKTDNAQRVPLHGGQTPRLIIETSSSRPANISQRAIGHIEHYAHTTDFVALWGVLHFVSSARESPTMSRFLGRVFARSSVQGGHQFVQHYLDGMFPLQQDPTTGAFTGCADTNDFMESGIELGREGDESADVLEAYQQSWLAALTEESHSQNGVNSVRRRTEVMLDVEVHTSSPILARQPSRLRSAKVKDVCRLWQYRNGKSPDDRPTGINRLATM